MTPKERELTAWIFQDEDTQADLETIIKMIVLSSLLELKDLGAAAARMISLIPENSSKTSISDEVKQLSDIMDKDAKGQIIWKDILEKWEEEKGAAGDELRNLIDEGLKKAETETIIK
ncbi:hypothetical protein N7509_004157 [Penicillium cosmopolitanum]|uniref:Uncharacterized protein n=1 Tax=Penicillium cosmopolitanum TaxID=1131564 RepID=A0A9W9W6N0_9EURO|nr:uncharacterized protein N7509_004157 [Penicillium cosmopolitanum]KAJ5404286.1 hypothetical protein N7509_004157 [Penicillium cosmopolitanum]